MDRLRYPPPGRSAPATLMVPVEYQSVKPVMSLVQYDPYKFEERRIETIDQLLPRGITAAARGSGTAYHNAAQVTRKRDCRQWRSSTF